MAGYLEPTTKAGSALHDTHPEVGLVDVTNLAEHHLQGEALRA